MTQLSLSSGLSRSEVFEKTLLVAVVLDLALGGNGYLIRFGQFRLREILYVACMTWVALRLTSIKPIRLDRKIMLLSALFVAVTAFGAALGYFNGNRVEAIVAELKPLSYFLMLLFFLVAIRTRDDVTLVAGLLVACGILLGSLYLLLLLSAKLGFVGYASIYNFLHVSDEFIFRHTCDSQAPFIGFFYKGTFYVCVATLFLMLDPLKITKMGAALTAVAVAMTLTRGLCFALAACIMTGLALNRNWRRAPLLAGLVILLLGVWFLAQQAERNLVETLPGTTTTCEAAAAAPAASASPLQSIERPSDAVRTGDIRFSVSNMSISALAVGRGLGAPIRGRERIEITYLEILYKQGILGLSVWLALFLLTIRLYRAVPSETKQFGLAYFLSVLFVFIATATNTFLTGSIGMGMVFISIASLLVLSRENRLPVPRTSWYWPAAQPLIARSGRER